MQISSLSRDYFVCSIIKTVKQIIYISLKMLFLNYAWIAQYILLIMMVEQWFKQILKVGVLPITIIKNSSWHIWVPQLINWFLLQESLHFVHEQKETFKSSTYWEENSWWIKWISLSKTKFPIKTKLKKYLIKYKKNQNLPIIISKIGNNDIQNL